jgi:hypothetical protein
MYKKLSNLNIDEIDEVAGVLVHSDSCPDCELALKHYPTEMDGVNFYLLDFDIEEELCNEFEVYRVPTFLFLIKGKRQGTIWGLQEPVSIKGFLKIHLERMYAGKYS